MPTTPPNLLNDDGTASMATALLMSHCAFRRDIARFATALDRVAAGDSPSVAALQAEWQNYRGALHGHHEVEDARIFPHLRSTQADLVAVIDQLAAQHRRIDPLLAAGDRAFASLTTPHEAALIVGQLSALLDEHLALEEAHVVRFLREAREFPPPATDEELAMFAEGFAWSSQGVAPEVLDRVYAMLPEVVRARLPAARAAFAQRSERVWGRAPEGASRTSVPDWLSAN
jgi:Hemerythrin HHE cation binding domain